MKVLVDHMNLVYISFHMTKKSLNDKGEEFTEDNIGLFYHSLFNKYNYMFKTYGPLIICHEGKGSLDWRRSIFPDYKRNRDASKKEESSIILKNHFKDIQDVLNLYPTKQISVAGAEADDVIYALSLHFANEGEEVLVISTDGDLSQIYNLTDKVKIYNPIRKTFAKIKPNIIQEKAIIGDNADNIPGIYRIGKKTFEKMLVDDNLFREKMKNGNRQIYENFLKIVDLSQFPRERHEAAIDMYNELPWNQFSPGKLEYFFFEQGMQDHISRWGRDSTDIINKLLEFGIKSEANDINIEIETSKKEINTSDVPISDTDEELNDILSEYV